MLILKHRDRKVVPGGGANAIYNLADLGVTVLPVGIVGDDEPGKLLLRAFRHKRIPVSGVFKDKSYATVTKTRILAGFAHTAGTAGRAPGPRARAKAPTPICAESWFWPRANMAGLRMRCWFPITDTARPRRRC